MSIRNALIVGGGFTGLTAAIALSQRGVEVTLIDLVAKAERGIPRIKGVVDASLLLAKWERDPGAPAADPGRVMNDSLAALVPAS